MRRIQSSEPICKKQSKTKQNKTKKKSTKPPPPQQQKTHTEKNETATTKP